jgi:hypothetical protein
MAIKSQGEKKSELFEAGSDILCEKAWTSCHDDICVNLPHSRSGGVMLICAFRGLGV